MLKTLTAFFTVLSLTAFSCDTPVFRYAMERWQADPYQFKIVHSRELTAKETAIYHNLLKLSKNLTGSANITVECIDLRNTQLPEWNLPLISDVELQVSYPSSTNANPAFWQCPLNPQTVKAVINSKVRTAVWTHLTEGSPAVWLFLPSPEQPKNEKALSILNKELKKQEAANEIPQLTTTAGTPKVPYFPIVKIVDPKTEQFLIKMLVAVEANLNTGEPVVFPVYGRGRALLPLIGEGINSDTIKRYASFVMGKCSCVVKQKNPGVDLLFNHDWSRNLGATWIEDEPMPQIGGFEEFIEEIELPPLNNSEVELEEVIITLDESVPNKTVSETKPWTQPEYSNDTIFTPLLKLLLISTLILLLIGSFLLIKRQ